MDRILSLIGILVGLPGFILLFFDGHALLAAAFFVAMVVLLLAAWLVSLPPFTMKSIDVELIIHEVDGSKATLSKTYQIRPNYGHLEHLTHRNIAADGSVSNIRWDDQPVPCKNIEKVMAEYHVTIRFPSPLERWRTFPGKLSYDLDNSFPATLEGLVYVADFPVKTAKITVRLPAGRKCSKANATMVRGGRKVPIKHLYQNDGGTQIQLKLKKPVVGAEYEIFWYW